MTATPPVAPTAGWIPTNDPAQRPHVMMPVQHVDKPEASTVAQADIGFAMNYGARGVRNLKFGNAYVPVQTAPVFGDAIKQARVGSEGENGALAVVREGERLVLRNVLQPDALLANDKAGEWVPFRPADTLQEYQDSIGQRAPRSTHHVRLLDPSIQAIVDDNVVFDARAPKVVATGGPVTLGGGSTTVVLTPPVAGT